MSEAIIACFATPPCLIIVGGTVVAFSSYYWWTHGGQEATAQAVQDLSTWFAKGGEKGEVKWYKRGMTKDQAERFQREVEEEKASEGRGPRDNLPPERMEEIRNDILEGRR